MFAATSSLVLGGLEGEAVALLLLVLVVAARGAARGPGGKEPRGYLASWE